MCHSANDRADSGGDGGDGGIPRRRAAAKAPQNRYLQCLFHHSDADDQIAPSDLPRCAAESKCPLRVSTALAAVSASLDRQSLGRQLQRSLPADLANSSNETAPAAMTVRAPRVRASARPPLCVLAIDPRARGPSSHPPGRARPPGSLRPTRPATWLARLTPSPIFLCRPQSEADVKEAFELFDRAGSGADISPP